MAKASILIVEDERIVAADIGRSLQSVGYVVSAIVSSGEEAVSKAEELKPDLVLMDIVLGGDGNGIQAAAQIHSRLDIPVVYLTAYAQEETLQRAKTTEPYGYIVKPFDDRELRSTVEMALCRHKAEKALRESEERYRGVIETSPDAITLTDLDSKILMCNRQVAVLLGFESVEEMIGEKTFEFFIPEDRQRAEDNARKTLETGSVRNVEYTLIKKDGTRFPAELSASLIRDTKGMPKAFMALTRDITERKQAEEELKKSYQKLQSLLEEIVHVLATAVEMRDPYTAGHQRRVAALADAIAEKMGLPGEQRKGLHMAAVIHDIGKLCVPAEILSRPGSLTDIELGLIKVHSQAGYDLLKPIEFPWPVAQTVLQHHERMDGSGFPQGLKGEDILLEARILAVADVVEAMSSHRPYRPAHDIDEALEEISQNKGVLYDPRVADACLEIFAGNGFKFEQDTE